MKKIIGLLIFIALIAFLYTSCPNKEDHTEALSEVIPEMVNAKFSEFGIDNILGSHAKGSEALQHFARAVVDVDDYLLFSIGRENFTAKDHVVSFGIAGHVFTVNDELFQTTSGLLDSAKDLTEDVADRLKETID